MRDSALRAVHDGLLVRRVRLLYGEQRAERAPTDGVPVYAEAAVDHKGVEGLTQTRGRDSAEAVKRGHAMAPTARAADVRRMAREWLPSGRVWEEVFTREEEREVLEAVHGLWRETDGVEACAAWARWLLEHGDGAGAMAVIKGAGGWLGTEGRDALGRRWTEVLREADREVDDDQGE